MNGFSMSLVCAPETLVRGTRTRLASLLALALGAWFVPVAHSAAIVLAWDANTEPDVAGYRLHYGTPPGDFAVTDDLGDVTNFTVVDLELGRTYAFYVTCYDTAGLESEPSNVVEYTVPDASSDESSPPTLPRLSGPPQLTAEGWSLTITGAPNKWVFLQRSSDLKNWEGIWTVFMGPEGIRQLPDTDLGQKAMFYRVVVP